MSFLKVKRNSKKKVKNLSLIFILLNISILSIFLNIQPVTAASGIYNEDFTTTTYMDSSNTNVTGWGSGTIELPHKTPIYTSTFNTPGEALRVFVSGDSAFIADGPSGVQAINISNLSSPISLDSYSTPDWAMDVFISGDYAYIACHFSGLQVIDISDPTNLVFAGSYDTPNSSRGVFVSGDYAYIADYLSGLQVIDISDPTNPSFAGSIDTPDRAKSVFISGDFAYISDATSGLQVIDISSPASPTFAGSCNTPNDADDVFISGDFAYVADGDSGLQVIDISDPTSPTIVGSYDTPDDAWGIYISGDYAYVADFTSGLQVINISDPTNPTFAGSYDTPSWCYDVFISGDYAYIADDTSGLQVIKISDVISPNYIGAESFASRDVHISGDYAYLASDLNGLTVIDISDPTQTSFAGSCDTPGQAWSVSIDGDYAYVGDITKNGLRVIDISDPTSPFFAGEHNFTGNINDIFISGDYAYIANDDYGLYVIDISNPTSPSYAGSYDTPYDAKNVFISGDYAYIADDTTLQVIDISDPTNPSFAGSYDNPGRNMGIFVEGNYLYIADYTIVGGFDLLVINITNPTNPVLASYYNLTGQGRDIFISGDYAYVAVFDSGFEVVNISDPKNPSFAGIHDTPHYANDICIEGDYAYVADTNALRIYEVRRNRCRQYESLAIAQSEPTFSGLSTETIFSANLTSLDSIPTNTSIDYYLSADNGSHWEAITPGLEHYFINSGNQLKWKAVLTTNHSLKTPKIFSLSIKYGTLLDAPSLLYPLNNSLTNDNTPTLEWTSVTGALNYFIQLDTSINFNSLNQINVTIGSTSYTLVTPLVDGLWYWRVAANDSEGDLGKFSEIWSMQIDTIPPNSPSLISPNNNSIISDNTPMFSWSSIFDAHNYTLQLDTSTSFSSIDLITIPGIISASYAPTSPLTDDTWYWQVCAVDEANNQGSYSDFNVLIIDTVAPTAPSLTSPGNNTILNTNVTTFSWSTILDAQNYTLQLDTSDLFTSPSLTTIEGITSTSYLLTTELNDDVWYWRVCSYDAANNQGPYSSPFRLFIDTLAPNEPSLISPGNNTNLNTNVTTFSWSAILDAQNYTLQLDISDLFTSPSLITIDGIISTSYLLITELNDGVWYWRVCSFDAANNQGPSSNPYVLTIDTIPPVVPSLIAPDQIFSNDNTPTFSWNIISDAYNYTLQLDTLNLFTTPSLITIEGITSTSYTLTTLLLEDTWYWRVCAFDAANNQGSYSSSFTINIDTTAPDINNPDDISYYEGETGKIVAWSPTDSNLDRWVIMRDDFEIANGSWDGGDIILGIDGLEPGEYVYNCTVYDKAMNSVSDIIIVTVIRRQESPAISFGNFFILFAILGVLIAVSIKKRKLNKNSKF